MGILKKTGLVPALMRSKGRFFPVLLFALLLMMVLPASAVGFGAPGTTYNSHWAYPSALPFSIVNNGHITPWDYANATVRDFTLNMRNGTYTKNVNATLFVKNDHTNIYVAIQIFHVPFNNKDTTNRWDAIAIFFDNNRTGVITQGDQGEEITTNSLSPCYSDHDVYYNSSQASWLTVVSTSKTEDGALAWNHTAYPTQGAIGNYTVEMKIPLNDTNPGYGLAIKTLPRTIGYKIWFVEGGLGGAALAGVYPDNTTIAPTDQTYNAATFGNLILNPLYTLIIHPPAGGNTSPAPGAYKFDYGEVATVTVTSTPSGYAFDHWGIWNWTGGSEGTPVWSAFGSTPSISIHMDDYMNHSLQAFFRPVVVGGMAAPIIIPVGEPNLLTPLIWLTSAIVCSVALTVLFAKLKKKKF